MSDAASMTVSDELEHWLGGDQPKTLFGNIIELFGERQLRADLRCCRWRCPHCRSRPAVRRTSSRW